MQANLESLLEMPHAWIVAAVLLLWLPYPTLSFRYKLVAGQNRYAHPDLRQLLGNWNNYLDFIRSFAGTLLLLRWTEYMQTVPTATPQQTIWTPLAVLAVGTLVQTIRLPSPVNFVAPVFYLSGITLLWPGRLEGLFSVLFAWAFVIASRNPVLFLPALGGALALVGFFNDGLSLALLGNLTIIALPLLLAALFNRNIIFIIRERKYAPRTKAQAKPSSAIRRPGEQPAALPLKATQR